MRPPRFIAIAAYAAKLRLSESNDTCINCRAWAVSQPFGCKDTYFFQIMIWFEEFNVILERFCYILIQKTRNTWNKECVMDLVPDTRGKNDTKRCLKAVAAWLRRQLLALGIAQASSALHCCSVAVKKQGMHHIMCQHDVVERGKRKVEGCE